MFMVVALETKPIRNIVVPLKYLQKIDLSDGNDGVNQSKSVLVFFNENWEMQPDFSLEIATSYCSENSACYYARLVRYFGEYQQ